MKCYISEHAIYTSDNVAKGIDEIQIKFKDDGKFISIPRIKRLSKEKRITRSEILALIKEAQKRNKIIDLSGRDLSRLNLKGMSFGRANLSNANLSSADLSNASFFSADLSYADLSYANLTYTDLSYADMTNAKTAGANMFNTNLFKSVNPNSGPA